MSGAFLPAPLRPADVLRERFEALAGVTQLELGAALGVSRLSANELLGGRRAVTASMALRLAHVFDTDPAFWMDLQRDWDLYRATQELGAEIAALPRLRIAQRPDQMVRPIAEIAVEARHAQAGLGRTQSE